MKRYISGIVAIIFSFLLVAFNSTNKIEMKANTATDKWFVFSSGAHDDENNYSVYIPTEEEPMPPTCEGFTRLCAIYVNDANSNNILDQAELASYLAAVDSNHDGSLDDEPVSGVLIKKP